MRTKRNDAVYFSSRLKAKLADAHAMRSISIEAPSGYGKTTLVQNFLREHVPAGAIWVRHVCAEESPQAAWRRFCQALQKIDEHSGKTLLALGLPDEDSTGDAAALLREVGCVCLTCPTWFVIDDFQHLAPHAPLTVWKALLEHDSPHLHVGIITRPLPLSVMPYEKAGFLRLTASDLRLTREESREYFAQAGVKLNTLDAEELHRRAEGWIIALTLYLHHWQEKGGFSPAFGRGTAQPVPALDGLLRDVIWDGLDADGRDFLLRLSPFECFSQKQAAFLLGKETLPPATMLALQKNALLRFDAASGLYYPHSTLLEFVRVLFAELPERAQRAIRYAAGDWCVVDGERKAAVAFYYLLRDFEKILSLNFYGTEDNRWMDMPGLVYADALRDIAAHCSRDIKIRHPMTAIQLAFELFGQGCHEDFGALYAEMNDIVENALPPGTPEEEQNYLRGELLLLESFTRYNNIAEMGTRMRRSAELTGGKTVLIAIDNSWSFSNASVLFMYHSEVGRLTGELADMRLYCPYYVSQSGGHGAGGPELMEAEYHLHLGVADMADVFGHKARHEAALHNQASVLIGAALLLGRSAFLRGDAVAFAAALEELARLNEEYPQVSNRLEADMAHAFLMGLAERPDAVAEWLREATPGSIAKRLFVPAVPFAELCRARTLLLTGKPEVLLGESDAALGLAEALHYPLALIYGHIHNAAAWHILGKGEQAQTALRQALALAVPDNLLLPFAESHSFVAPVLAELLPTLPQSFAHDLLSLTERQKAGLKAVAGKLSPQGFFGLTPREYEVARLAAEGLTLEEVAQRLYISLNTVKTHLKTAYRKTGTSSRRMLKKIVYF